MATIKLPKGDEWICDACGGKHGEWEIRTYDGRPDRLDVLVLVCPDGKGVNVYQFAYHSHVTGKNI